MSRRNKEGLMYTTQNLEKIRSLLDSNEEVNIRMAFQIAKGMGIPHELYTDFTDTFFKIMLCLEEGILAPIYNLKKLEIFALEQFKKLPDSIGELTQLKMLNLCANVLENISENIGRLHRLQYLNLDSNQLTKLPQSLGQLKRLEWLELGQNNLEILPESIGQLSNLRYLNLTYNKIQALPNSFYELNNLTELYIEGNLLNVAQIQRLKEKMPNTRIIV